MKNEQKAGLFPPIALGIVAIIVLTAIFFVVTAPSSSISAGALPDEVKLGVSGQVPGATPTLPAIFIPTAIPLPSPTVTPAPTATSEAEPTAGPSPTATPTPEPTATPTPAPVGVIPVRLKIPSIGVDAYVEKVGQTKDGAMDTPKNIFDVGWYELGAKPGQIGSAVIAGHLDGPHTAAVFWDLSKVKPGQKIYVVDDQGKELTFEVQELQVYPYDQAPLDKIFVDADDIRLNLITCNGTFDQRSLNYNNRLVVYTKLVKEGN